MPSTPSPLERVAKPREGRGLDIIQEKFISKINETPSPLERAREGEAWNNIEIDIFI